MSASVEDVPEGYVFVGGLDSVSIDGLRVAYAEVFRGPGGMRLERGRVREGGPLAIEKWSLDGIAHRVDGGPALRRHVDPTGLYAPTEDYLYEAWLVDGRPHRGGAPAQMTTVNGQPITQTWCVRGELSRLDGPAIDVTGSRIIMASEKWWVRGIETTEDGMAAAMRRLSDEEFADELFFSVYGDVLAEGYDRDAVTDAIAEGITTAEGLRGRLDGAPMEWVQSFESAEALGCSAEQTLTREKGPKS